MNENSRVSYRKVKERSMTDGGILTNDNQYRDEDGYSSFLQQVAI